MLNIFEITSAEEYIKIKKNVNKKMILKFSSNNCPPCKALDKIIGQCKYDREINILNIKGEECESIALSYGITVAPTTLIINEKGEEKTRKIGYMTVETWEKFLQEEFYSCKDSDKNKSKDIQNIDINNNDDEAATNDVQNKQEKNENEE